MRAPDTFAVTWVICKTVCNTTINIGILRHIQVLDGKASTMKEHKPTFGE